MAFTQLSVLTDFSFLSSTITYEKLLQRAQDQSLSAVAISDQMNLFAAIPFYKASLKKGIKPLLGVRAFIVDDLDFKGERPELGLGPEGKPTSLEQGIFTLTLYAENLEGYRNLCRLVSQGYGVGYVNSGYKFPLINHALLEKYSEGVILLSGNLKSELASFVAAGREDQAEQRVARYAEKFKNRFYLEAQNNGLPIQQKINAFIENYSQRHGVPVCATHDCHYLNQDEARYHKIMMCIGRGMTLGNALAPSFVNDSFFYKSEQEMLHVFAGHEEWLQTTDLIAQRCDVNFKFADEKGRLIYHLPQFRSEKESQSELSAVDELKHHVTSGLQELGMQGKHIEERAEFEIQTIAQMGFEGYFLIVADFIRWAKKKEIPVGPGRGSGAGSLVAYALGITDLDPLQHGLLFERFLNPERISMPDFDIDFCQDRREEVIQYVRQRYGDERVAKIINFGKMAAKAVVRDVGRVFGVPFMEMDGFAKLIPNEIGITLKRAIEIEPKITEVTQLDARMKDVLDVALQLEGMHRQAGIHAAGIIISDHPLTHYCALYQSQDGDWMTQVDGKYCEEIGLVKFDFLGLKTLTSVQKTVDLINTKTKFDLTQISYEDPQTFKLISAGDTVAVFQLESSGMQALCQQLGPENFEDITAINALYRPGPLESGMTKEFVARKKKQVPITYDIKEMEEILKNTYGAIVYQEQVQQLAVTLASYTLGGADLLRRAMGKKKPEEMAKQRAIFLEGAHKNGHNPKIAEKIFDQMEKFAEYGFNKSHAAAYMKLAFQTAYLKTHFPVEFYAAHLTTEMGDIDKIALFCEDARKHRIKIFPPDINQSLWEFVPAGDGSLRFGLGAIKGVGQGAIEAIVRERQSGGAYRGLLDLIQRVDGRTVNKKTLEALIKAGAFDFSKIPRARMMVALADAMKQGERFHKLRESHQTMLFGGDDLSFHHDSFWKGFEKIDEWELTHKLQLEFDIMGIFLSGHPLEKYLAKTQLYVTGQLGTLKEMAQLNERVSVAGFIQNMRDLRTKKGEKMARLTLGDLSGSADVVLFPESFRKFESALKSGSPLLVVGQLSEIDAQGRCTLIVGREGHVQTLDQLDLKDCSEIHITIQGDDRAEGSTLLYVSEILKRHHGSCPSFLRIRNQKGEAQLKLPKDLHVSLSDALVKELVDVCGPQSVKFGSPLHA